MKVSIPFDEAIFREQMAISFHEIWSHHISANKRNMIGGITGTLIGLFLWIYGSKLGIVIFVLGAHYLFNSISYYRYYKKEKDDYLRLLDEEVEQYLKAQNTSVWQFEEEHLIYSDHKFETKIKWATFKGYRLVDDTLFFDLDHRKANAMAIGKNELDSDETWNKILNIVKSHLTEMA